MDLNVSCKKVDVKLTFNIDFVFISVKLVPDSWSPNTGRDRRSELWPEPFCL